MTAPDNNPKDLSFDDVYLNGRKWRRDLTKAVLEANMRRTIEGASEVKIDLADPDYTILNSGMFGRGTTISVDGIKFVLVKPAKGSAGRLSMTFEDAEVAKLRGFKRPRKVFRDKVSRVGFARMLVREARTIKFFTADSITPGFTPDEKFKVRGKNATGEQRRNLAKLLAAGHKRKAPRKVMQAAVISSIVHANARNGVVGKRVGLLGLLPRWGTVAKRKNIAKASEAFYASAMRIYKAKPNRSAAGIAALVQRERTATIYNKRAAEAKRIIDLYFGETDRSSEIIARKVRTVRYAFSRGKPGGEAGEDTWTCLQRLATEVGWRAFMVKGVVWFVSEYHLFKMKPVATITPTTPGVEDVTGDTDTGLPASEASIDARVGRWKGQPGSVVTISGYGFLDGRWLVVEIERSLFSTRSRIKVRKPTAKLPEPKAEAIGDTASSSSSSSDVDAPDSVKRAYDKAVAIDKKGYKYSYGGGHGSGNGPYDCSGAVSAIMRAAGVMSGSTDTVGFGRLGKPGVGKYLTMYVKPFAGKSGHIYAVFNLPGKGEQRFEAHGPQGAGPGGQFVSRGSDSGYHARHFEGM